MPRSALTGSRIRERRTILGMRQAELARRVEISPSYLNLIEHNRRRIGGKLVIDIARVLDVEPKVLTEGAEAILIETLREAAAGQARVRAEIDRVDEFAGRFPGWADLIGSQRRRIADLERTVRTLTDRLTHDPFLSTSLHEVISTVTAIRASSSILTETDDLDPEWQTRFHRNIHEESQRLTESSQALVAYLDGVGDAGSGLTSPQEELEGFLVARRFHIAELEGDDPADPAAVADDAEMLTSSAARSVATAYLSRYAADAAALPMDILAEAAARRGADPFALAQELHAPLPVVLRRLATLPAEQAPAAMGLVCCDASGTLTFRREAESFPLPRHGAACPLWPLFDALARPMTPIRTVVAQSGRQEARFITYAIAETLHPAGFGGPTVTDAVMLIVPLDSAAPLSEPIAPVGVSCRICPRTGCVARREPSILGEGF